jgi:membrane-associated protein
MELIAQVWDLFVHLDRHLADIIAAYGAWTYLLLFIIVFCETGLVVTPILPGDSLLFAAGALAATGALNPVYLFVLLAVAAILGDTVNYAIGKSIGPRVFRENIRFIKKEYLFRTQEFYQRHGGKTIFLARFVPIIRTFAPFVAGVGTMTYRRFVAYNVFGGVVWTGLFIFAGFRFGSLPAVKENFTLVILAIVFISILPIVIEYLRQRARGASGQKGSATL